MHRVVGGIDPIMFKLQEKYDSGQYSGVAADVIQIEEARHPSGFSKKVVLPQQGLVVTVSCGKPSHPPWFSSNGTTKLKNFICPNGEPLAGR